MLQGRYDGHQCVGEVKRGERGVMKDIFDNLLWLLLIVIVCYTIAYLK